MSKKKSIFILLGSILLSLLLGLIVGVIIDDFPRLTLDTNIRIFEPLSFCLTIAVGIIIPFIFKSIIDDNRQIKSYLIDEIRSFSRSVEDIPDKINEYYFQKTISPDEKDRINALFEKMDLKLGTLINCISYFYKNQTKECIQQLKDSYLDYWKFLTGSEIMTQETTSIMLPINSDIVLQENMTKQLLKIEKIITKYLRELEELKCKEQ